MQTRFPPVVIVLVFVVAMYGVSISPLALPFDTGANGWIGGALIAAGVVVVALGVARFRRQRTTVDPRDPAKASALVTSGIFGLTRNPMYLGMLLALLGTGTALGSGGAVLLALLFVPLITALQIRAEEAAMRKLFGAHYDDYAARVRRWL